MTEEKFTPEQVASICEITQKLFGGAAADDMKKSLITTNIAEGQVMVWEGWPFDEPPEFKPSIMVYHHGNCAGYRPLNQTEVGDGFITKEEHEKIVNNMVKHVESNTVPRAEFDKLRDALEAATTGRPWVEGDYAACVREFERRIKSIKDALDAIPENLK